MAIANIPSEGTVTHPKERNLAQDLTGYTIIQEEAATQIREETCPLKDSPQ